MISGALLAKAINKVPREVWIGCAAAFVIIAFGVTACSFGASGAKTEIKAGLAKQEQKATVATGRTQTNLDGETTQIGDNLRRSEAATVQIIERVRTEIRYEAAKETDPTVRLRAWRDRIDRLRDTVCLDREPGADGDNPSQCPGALPLAGTD